MNGDPVLVHFGTGLNIVNDARQHAVGGLADFDGCLAGARSIHGQKTNPVGQNCGEALRQIFLAAIKAIHRNDQWHGAFGILGKAQVTGDFGIFKRDVNYLEGRIPESGMSEKSFDRLGIRTLFSRRGWHRPASERIEPPGPDVVGIRFLGVALLQRLSFGHVAVSNPHEGGGPFIFIFCLDRLKCVTNIGGVEADERVHAVLGALDGLGLDLIQRAFSALLGE